MDKRKDFIIETTGYLFGNGGISPPEAAARTLHDAFNLTPLHRHGRPSRAGFQGLIVCSFACVGRSFDFSLLQALQIGRLPH